MSSFLEIVELVNGDIVLQRADGEGEALMTINFSDESKAYLPEGRLEVARAMIHAGIETASQLEIVRAEPSPQDPAGQIESLEAEAGLAEDFGDAADRVLH
ncbi:MAG: hypothetical protein KJP25_02055 [Gammaproteobacteria bacterium]|nr:hypothetical protein [Gammaproteobacteria bacterium]NND39431.1 hypothetical protein [Pseudomonadales bacterium]MBT8150418.1 hypothetical protein [Gammaproteobacteria bacterium]NNL11910.1 hypothetical protein [Pseudomonadales bacterium]NNM11780.1 hypothetical protein [Pseudomonadales bacterium]